jgi:hypothetical protein
MMKALGVRGHRMRLEAVKFALFRLDLKQPVAGPDRRNGVGQDQGGRVLVPLQNRLPR